MTWCKTCGDYVYESRERAHVCPPTWDVWAPSCGDERGDWKPTYARDAEDAAEKWAEEYDAGGDYTIVGGSGMTVHVARVGEDAIARFVVTGEAVPEYSAREVPA